MIQVLAAYRKQPLLTKGYVNVVYEHWRQNPDGKTWQDPKILNDIRDYSIDDCNSTQELVDWLRKQQSDHSISYLGKTSVDEPEIYLTKVLRVPIYALD